MKNQRLEMDIVTSDVLLCDLTCHLSSEAVKCPQLFNAKTRRGISRAGLCDTTYSHQSE